MDIALKQRLVGATVIVCLAVIFIPMLLDGPEDGEGPGVAATIPEPPDGRYETRRLPLNPSLAARENDPESATVPPAPRPTAPRPSPVAPAAERIERPPAQSDEPDPAPLELPQPVAEAERALPEAAMPTSQAGPGTWFLQLGTFSRVANANGLVATLREAGFDVRSDPVIAGNRTLHRVRVGNFETRELAMDAAARIGEQIPAGEDISLRRVVDDGQEDSEEPAGTFGWWVQAGVFSSETNALALRDRLRAAGLVANVDTIELSGKQRFRVRVGPELDRADADAVRGRLRNEFDINALVVGNS